MSAFQFDKIIKTTVTYNTCMTHSRAIGCVLSMAGLCIILCIINGQVVIGCVLSMAGLCIINGCVLLEMRLLSAIALYNNLFLFFIITEIIQIIYV